MNIAVRYIVPVLIFLVAVTISAQTTAFTYQGKLTDSGSPASGAFQMQFKLFDALAGGTQIGSTISDIPITANDGVFSVKLDFGSNALSGANRWLEIAVRHNSGESYTTLNPREQIASSPYAVRTLSAVTADNALQLGGIPASDYVTNASVGSSFVRNGTTLQTGNFNISGNGYIGGSLGVGTTTPGFTLDVMGPVRSLRSTSTDFIAQTTGGTNAWARFSMFTPSQSWSIGSSQDFNGNQFYLHDLTNAQNRFTVQPNGGAISFPLGNVGIGATNPTAKFEIAGAGFGAQQRITDSASGNSLVLQSGAGTDMKVTGYNYNTGTAVPLNLSVDGANLGVGGNVTQPRDKSGMPKAMVFINGINGSIVRCYNGLTGVSIPTCGISAERIDVGVYRLTFPFQINDRFFALSTFGGGIAPVNDTIIGQTLNFPTSTSVRIFISESTTGGHRDGDFCFIVY